MGQIKTLSHIQCITTLERGEGPVKKSYSLTGGFTSMVVYILYTPFVTVCGVVTKKSLILVVVLIHVDEKSTKLCTFALICTLTEKPQSCRHLDTSPSRNHYIQLWRALLKSDLLTMLFIYTYSARRPLKPIIFFFFTWYTKISNKRVK